MSLLTSFILALRVVLVAKLVISGILFSPFFILALYTSFLTTYFFPTSLSLLKSTGKGINLSTSYLSTLLFKLLKLVRTFFSLSISNLSTLDFKLGKSCHIFKSTFFWRNQINLIQLLLLVLQKIHLLIICIFLSIQLLKTLLQPFYLTYSLLPFPFITFTTLNSF